MGFLTWLQETGIAQFLLVDPYAFPILLVLHSLGMAAVVGLVWVMTLRVLGFPAGLSPQTFRRMTDIALWGFALNFVSGFLLFMTEATRVIVNTEFQLKMLGILIGIISVWFLGRASRVLPDDDGASFSTPAKIAAIVTSLAWIAAIFFGRQIADTIKPPC